MSGTAPSRGTGAVSAWEKNVRRVIPYVPGEQPKNLEKIIKLNTNEFPYPPCPAVREALKRLDAGLLKLYPDPAAEPLTSAIALRYGVGNDQVFVGTGSDDVLSMAFLTFFYGKDPVLFADITYSFYDVWAEVYRIPYEIIPLDERFHIRKEDYYRKNGGIIIANPNAPTGIDEAGDLSFFEDIVKNNPSGVVIFDEAYVDFGGTSALPLTKKYDNVLIVQTFSKSRAFAGMRIGYAIGSPRLIKYMNDVKYSVNSYTMNRPAIELGVAALSDEAYFKETVDKVIRTRERTKKELRALGFEVSDSRTNFVFCTHPRKKAREIFESLKEQGVYVRYFNKPRIDNHLRISIGTDEEMDRLCQLLSNIL